MHYVYLTNTIVTDQAQVDPFSIFSAPYAEQFIEAPDEVTCNWKLEDGNWVAPPIIPINFNDLEVDTQKRLDDFAATKGYSDIVSVCTYATSSNLQYKSDADYCVLSRDNTWEKLYLIFNEIEQGKRPMPTDYNQIAVDLPVLAWPVI
jgi:hypothetical protein